MTPYRLLIALMLLSAPVPVPAQDSDVPAGLDITLPRRSAGRHGIRKHSAWRRQCHTAIKK